MNISDFITDIFLRKLFSPTKINSVSFKYGEMTLKIKSQFLYYIYFVFISAGFILILPIILWLLGEGQSMDDNLLLICFALCFFLTGFILLQFYKKTMIVADNIMITYHMLFGRSKEMMWNEIKEIKASKSHHSIYLLGDFKKMEIPVYFVGISDLIEFIKTKVNPLCYENFMNEIKS